jgi:diadenosine tetraphosphate (Ap4A) HIT family hydrolase
LGKTPSVPLLVGDPEPGCGSCAALAQSSPAPRDALAATGTWALAHAFSVGLEGWLVLLPRRHVASIDALTEAEAAALGPLLRAASGALRAVTGCAKTYVAQFAEAAAFSHVHFHVIPRAADLEERFRGPRVFALMGAAEHPEVPADRRDAIALALRHRLVGAGAAEDPTAW